MRAEGNLVDPVVCEDTDPFPLFRDVFVQTEQKGSHMFNKTQFLVFGET